MAPLDQLSTPTPQHIAEMDADLIFQDVNHSHLTPAYSTPKPIREEYLTTPSAPGQYVATSGYILDDSATPSYFYQQGAGNQSPPYNCDSPRILENDEAPPPAAPAEDVEMPDSNTFECKTPCADEAEEESTQVAEARVELDQHAEETERDDSASAPPPAEPKEVINLRPIVLKTYQIKKKKKKKKKKKNKSKKADIEADITATVEVITWSWFMNLPLEVRHRIYNYYFFPEGKDWAPRPTFREKSIWRMQPPALLQCDPYIRKEAIATYYGELKISVDDPEDDLVPWLKTLDPKARFALQDITISYDRQDPEKTNSQTKKSRCIDRCLTVLGSNKVRLKREAFTGVYLSGGQWL